MKPIRDLLPFVLPWAQGASEPAAILALRSAAIEFCKRTKVWQTPPNEPMSVRAGDPFIELVPPLQAELVEIREVFYHDTPLHPASEGWKLENGITPGRRGSPQGYEQQVLDDRALNEFSLVPTPAVSEPRAITVRAAWMPSRTATQLPDALVTRYAEELGYGALARLHMTGEPWARAPFGQDKQGQFEQAIGVAVSAVAKANVRARRRVKASFF